MDVNNHYRCVSRQPTIIFRYKVLIVFVAQLYLRYFTSIDWLVQQRCARARLCIRSVIKVKLCTVLPCGRVKPLLRALIAALRQLLVHVCALKIVQTVAYKSLFYFYEHQAPRLTLIRHHYDSRPQNCNFLSKPDLIFSRQNNGSSYLTPGRQTDAEKSDLFSAVQPCAAACHYGYLAGLELIIKTFKKISV